MAIKVDLAPEFRKKLKAIKKKYSAATKEIRGLVIQLEQDECPGDKVSDVGYDVRKVRLKNPDAGKGKSGGFRVLYYLHLADHVILLTIYSKTDQSDISSRALKDMLDSIALDNENSD